MNLGPSSVEYQEKEQPDNPWRAPECVHCGKPIGHHWQTANGRIWCTKEYPDRQSNPRDDDHG